MIRGEDQARWAPWLLTGERLLWAGRPKRGLAFRWADLYLVPLTLAWGAAALVMEFGLWRDAAPALGFVWALPFALLAFYIFPGRFLLDAILRARIHYAVTSRRILVLRSGPFAELKSVELDYLPTLELREGGGRGTILFDPGDEPGTSRGEGWGHSLPALRRGLRFYRIDRPRLVYDLIHRETERRRLEIVGKIPPHRAFIG